MIKRRYCGHILVHPVEGQNFANTNIGIVYQIRDLIKEVMWWEYYIWLSIEFTYFMTTYKMHTCLRRRRFSYLVVLCARSDWKSDHLYATPAGGSIKGRAGERFNSCFWWYSICEGFSVNLKCNIPLWAKISLSLLWIHLGQGWRAWLIFVWNGRGDGLAGLHPFPLVTIGHHRLSLVTIENHWEPWGIRQMLTEVWV